jgi:hypothetical protein
MKKFLFLFFLIFFIFGKASAAPWVRINGSDSIFNCGNDVLSLEGSKSGAFSTYWYTIDGYGTFSNPNSLKTSYTLSPLDYQLGRIRIVIRHQSNSQIADTVTVLLGNIPQVEFITDECKNYNAFSYSSQNADKIEFKTLGDGYFNNSDYRIGSQDCQKGEVTLIICATNYICNITTCDTFTFNVPDCKKTVDILMSANTINCIVEDSVRLEAIFSDDEEILGGWSSSGSGSFSSSQSNGTVIYYTPSPEDLELGYVNIITNFVGKCWSYSEYSETLFFGKPGIDFDVWESDCGDDEESKVVFFPLSDQTNDSTWFENFENIEYEIKLEGDGTFVNFLSALFYTPGPMDRINGYFKVTIITKNPLFPECPGDTNEILFKLSSPSHIYASKCPVKITEDKPTECLSGFLPKTAYQWFKSTTGCGNWELIPGAKEANYSPPGFNSKKICYIRKSYCINESIWPDFWGNKIYDTCTFVSNCVCVEPCLNDEPVPDTIKNPKSLYERLNKINSFGLSLSPNPASDNVRIQFNNPSLQNFEVIIYNLLGEKIIDVESSNNNSLFDKTIDLSSIGKGIYMVNIRFLDGTVITQKFIKQ